MTLTPPRILTVPRSRITIAQRQDLYERLLAIDMPDIIAAAMAAQTNSVSLGVTNSGRITAILSFAVWYRETKEGAECWAAIHESASHAADHIATVGKVIAPQQEPAPMNKPVWPMHRPTASVHNIVLDGVSRDFQDEQIISETCGLADAEMIKFYRQAFHLMMERDFQSQREQALAQPEHPAQQEPADECDYSCKVCSNKPDSEGILEHGSGCYVVQPEGGGSEFIADAVLPTPVRQESSELDLSQVSRITHTKAKTIAAGGDYAITGFVMTQTDGLKCIVDMDSVLWFDEPNSFRRIFQSGATSQKNDHRPIGIVYKTKDVCVGVIKESSMVSDGELIYTASMPAPKSNSTKENP